jgi:hypothetical protein
VRNKIARRMAKELKWRGIENGKESIMARQQQGVADGIKNNQAKG